MSHDYRTPMQKAADSMDRFRKACSPSDATAADEPQTEMTLRQWVEQLPPMHRARKELRELNERADCYAEQIARLPGCEEGAYTKDIVDSTLRRLLDTESALASLVYLASKFDQGMIASHLEGFDAAIEAAEKLLDARPSALGGTAWRADR